MTPKNLLQLNEENTFCYIPGILFMGCAALKILFSLAFPGFSLFFLPVVACSVVDVIISTESVKKKEISNN